MITDVRQWFEELDRLNTDAFMAKGGRDRHQPPTPERVIFEFFLTPTPASRSSTASPKPCAHGCNSGGNLVVPAEKQSTFTTIPSNAGS